MSSVPANYFPVRRLIANVTQEIGAIVTTNSDHEYEEGQLVRLIVPKAYGMDINYVESIISVLSSTTFKTEIDTRSLLSFVDPTFPPSFTQAHVVPITGVTDNRGIQ